MKGYAINKAGLGVMSDPVTCYTVAPPGQAGRPLRVSSTDTTITLQWDAAFEESASPVTEYQVFYDLVEGIGSSNIENWVLGANGNFLTTTLTLTSLKQYRFKVRAKSGNIIAGEWSPISEYFISHEPPTPSFDLTKIMTDQS